jgi:hypothetical protein
VKFFTLLKSTSLKIMAQDLSPRKHLKVGPSKAPEPNCGPNEYAWRNFFSSGCKPKDQDRRRLALQFHPELRAREHLNQAVGRVRGAAQRFQAEVGRAFPEPEAYPYVYDGQYPYVYDGQYPYVYDGLTPGQRQRILQPLGQRFYGTRDIAYGNVVGLPVGGAFYHDGLDWDDDNND